MFRGYLHISPLLNGFNRKRCFLNLGSPLWLWNFPWHNRWIVSIEKSANLSNQWWIFHETIFSGPPYGTHGPPSVGPRSEAYERWNVIYVSCPRNRTWWCDFVDKGKLLELVVDDMGNHGDLIRFFEETFVMMIVCLLAEAEGQGGRSAGHWSYSCLVGRTHVFYHLLGSGLGSKTGRLPSPPITLMNRRGQHVSWWSLVIIITVVIIIIIIIIIMNPLLLSTSTEIER